MWGKDWYSFFIWRSNFSRTIHWTEYPLSVELFWHLYIKSTDCICSSLFQDSLFCPIDLCQSLHQCYTILSLELSSKSWNQVVWVPQLLLFSKLFWIVQLSSIPIYILDLAWQFLQKSLLRFRWLHSIYISIWGEITF